jgi:hypothetical protein
MKWKIKFMFQTTNQYIYIRWRIKVPGGFPGGFHAGFVVNFHGDKKWLNFWDLSWDLLGYLWLIYG